ncbi:uncharacterized protein LOC100373072 [Saccoglossus kowalevskii]
MSTRFVFNSSGSKHVPMDGSSDITMSSYGKYYVDINSNTSEGPAVTQTTHQFDPTPIYNQQMEPTSRNEEPGYNGNMTNYSTVNKQHYAGDHDGSTYYKTLRCNDRSRLYADQNRQVVEYYRDKDLRVNMERRDHGVVGDLITETDSGMASTCSSTNSHNGHVPNRAKNNTGAIHSRGHNHDPPPKEVRDVGARLKGISNTTQTYRSKANKHECELRPMYNKTGPLGTSNQHDGNQRWETDYRQYQGDVHNPREDKLNARNKRSPIVGIDPTALDGVYGTDTGRSQPRDTGMSLPYATCTAPESRNAQIEEREHISLSRDARTESSNGGSAIRVCAHTDTESDSRHKVDVRPRSPREVNAAARRAFFAEGGDSSADSVSMAFQKRFRGKVDTYEASIISHAVTPISPTRTRQYEVTRRRPEHRAAPAMSPVSAKIINQTTNRENPRYVSESSSQNQDNRTIKDNSRPREPPTYRSIVNSIENALARADKKDESMRTNYQRSPTRMTGNPLPSPPPLSLMANTPRKKKPHISCTFANIAEVHEISDGQTTDEDTVTSENVKSNDYRYSALAPRTSIERNSHFDYRETDLDSIERRQGDIATTAEERRIQNSLNSLDLPEWFKHSDVVRKSVEKSSGRQSQSYRYSFPPHTAPPKINPPNSIPPSILKVTANRLPHDTSPQPRYRDEYLPSEQFSSHGVAISSSSSSIKKPSESTSPRQRGSPWELRSSSVREYSHTVVTESPWQLRTTSPSDVTLRQPPTYTSSPKQKSQMTSPRQHALPKEYESPWELRSTSSSIESTPRHQSLYSNSLGSGTSNPSQKTNSALNGGHQRTQYDTTDLIMPPPEFQTQQPDTVTDSILLNRKATQSVTDTPPHRRMTKQKRPSSFHFETRPLLNEVTQESKSSQPTQQIKTPSSPIKTPMKHITSPDKTKYKCPSASSPKKSGADTTFKLRDLPESPRKIKPRENWSQGDETDTSRSSQHDSITLSPKSKIPPSTKQTSNKSSPSENIETFYTTPTTQSASETYYTKTMTSPLNSTSYWNNMILSSRTTSQTKSSPKSSVSGEFYSKHATASPRSTPSERCSSPSSTSEQFYSNSVTSIPSSMASNSYTKPMTTSSILTSERFDKDRGIGSRSRSFSPTTFKVKTGDTDLPGSPTRFFVQIKPLKTSPTKEDIEIAPPTKTTSSSQTDLTLTGMTRYDIIAHSVENLPGTLAKYPTSPNLANPMPLSSFGMDYEDIDENKDSWRKSDSVLTRPKRTFGLSDFHQRPPESRSLQESYRSLRKSETSNVGKKIDLPTVNEEGLFEFESGQSQDREQNFFPEQKRPSKSMENLKLFHELSAPFSIKKASLSVNDLSGRPKLQPDPHFNPDGSRKEGSHEFPMVSYSSQDLSRREKPGSHHDLTVTITDTSLDADGSFTRRPFQSTDSLMSSEVSYQAPGTNMEEVIDSLLALSPSPTSSTFNLGLDRDKEREFAELSFFDLPSSPMKDEDEPPSTDVSTATLDSVIVISPTTDSNDCVSREETFDFGSDCHTFDDEKEIDDEKEDILGEELIMVKCRYKKCGKNMPLREARNTYKSCHNCYTYYCSRDCRKAHWEKHKKKCIFSRVSSACKHVIYHSRHNEDCLQSLSRMARTGYLSRGRGCITLLFADPEIAEEYLKYGVNGCEIPPTYTSARELEESGVTGEHMQLLIKMCKSYNPEYKFVVNVAIVVSNEPPIKPLPRHEGTTIKKCAKLRLSQNMSPKREMKPIPEDSDTLILTAPPGSPSRGGLDKKSRQVCFINIQRNLRQRGVSLRHRYPRVYDKLCAWVEDNENFAPMSIYPYDTRTGKQFMCVIMPTSDPDELEWARNPEVLECIDLDAEIERLETSVVLAMEETGKTPPQIKSPRSPRY